MSRLLFIAVALVFSASALPEPKLNASALAQKATAAAAAVNATLTLKASDAVVDPALPPLTGPITCYVDPGTGDVVGLQLGTAAPLCSTAGAARTFTVPAGSHVTDLKVAVDPATGLVGELVFVVKSASSPLPASIISCGTQGAPATSVVPKLSALATLGATCKPAFAGRRLLAVRALALDPAGLTIAVTTLMSSPPLMPSPPLPTFAYIPARFASPGTITACTVAGTSLSACVGGQGSSLSSAYGIAVAGGYAYITNGGGTYDKQVTVCSAAGGTVSSCAPVTVSTSSLNGGIAVAGGYVYVITNSKVTACAILGSSLTTPCAAVDQGSGFTSPSSIAISGSYAYIGNTGGTITVCALGGGGTLGACATPVAVGVSDVRGIAAADGWVYVANDAPTNKVSSCRISGNTVDPCTQSALPFVDPVALTVVGGVAYIASDNNNCVYACAASAGVLSACVVNTGFTGGPFGIAVAA